MTFAELNRANWKTWRFDQMAENIKDVVARPSESGFERFVGLEHLDADSLKVWRWGSTSDVEKSKLLFRKGDIIFGRRNAYLRRVAVADFDGVCSAHALVLRARSDVVLPEFLPFFMQSDGFWERALKVSAGSMSPTINWPNIAKERFSLPPLEEQHRIARLLDAHERQLWKINQLAIASSSLLNSSVCNLLTGESHDSYWNKDYHLGVPSGWRVLSLGSLLRRVIDYRGRTPQKSPNGIPLITARNIRPGYLTMDPQEFIPASAYASWMTRGIPEPGDVFFTMEAPLGYVAQVPEYKFALAQRIVVLQPNQTEVTSRYLYWLLQSPLTQSEVRKRATGTTAKGIRQSALVAVPVLVPQIEQQMTIAETLDAMLSARSAVHDRLNSSFTMKRQALQLSLYGLGAS